MSRAQDKMISYLREAVTIISHCAAATEAILDNPETSEKLRKRLHMHLNELEKSDPLEIRILLKDYIGDKPVLPARPFPEEPSRDLLLEIAALSSHQARLISLYMIARETAEFVPDHAVIGALNAILPVHRELGQWLAAHLTEIAEVYVCRPTVN